ncbi:MAG TPA: putative Ig domain-containing protein [Longimicrobiales bacterium]|nr:putative Ig domain-containing protein [Longimicrobiales bacterium]
MRIRARRFRALITGLVPVAFVLSCDSSTEPPGNNGGGGQGNNTVATVEITPQGSTNISLGGTLQLQATPRNAQNQPVGGQTITWSSQNNQVAQVNGIGLVTGMGVGTTQIVAAAGGKTGQITVTVVDNSPPGTPGNLVVTPVSDTRIDLSWSAATGTVTSYVIEREVVVGAAVVGVEPPAAAFSQVATVPGNTTSYSDTGLDPSVTYRYRVGACNANGCSGFSGPSQTKTFQTLVIETTSLPDGAVSQPYSAQLAVSGGSGLPAWSIVEGSLPAGLTLNASTGAITGTPTTAGNFQFTVRATGGGQTVERQLTIEIAPPPNVVIETASLPDGTVGVPYDQTLQASGGDGVNYAWSIVSGALPTGLSLNGATGRISGIPAASGAFAFTVEVESGGDSNARQLTITVNHPPVTIQTGSLPNGTQGTPYSQTLQASGGDGVSYAWDITDGALPTGLTLNGTTGQISGTPTAVGTFPFTVRVQSGGQSATKAFSIQIAAATPVVLENWYLPAGYVGAAYSHPIVVSGGTGTYEFAVTSGALPDGLSINANGVIQGVPTGSPATYFFQVTVQSGASSASRVYALSISNNPKSGFNISIMNGNGTMPPAALVTALNEAIAVWEGAITSNFGSFVMLNPPVTAAFCFPSGQFQAGFRPGEVIEDLAIMLFVRELDGIGTTLAAAGGCGYEVSGRITSGTFHMDVADVLSNPDLTPDRFRALAIHEIGHVLGFSEHTWHPRGLIQGNGVNENGLAPCGSNPRYVGAGGVAGYHAVGGSEDDIPVENQGQTGTCDSHWRETVFDTEIMTSFIESAGVAMPLSIMTLRALEDVGYTTNHAAAEPYTVPAAAIVDAAREETGDSGLWVGSDVLHGPVLVVGADGTVLEVIPPTWERQR